jgi:hypothetical protein
MIDEGFCLDGEIRIYSIRVKIAFNSL